MIPLIPSKNYTVLKRRDIMPLLVRPKDQSPLNVKSRDVPACLDFYATILAGINGTFGTN